MPQRIQYSRSPHQPSAKALYESSRERQTAKDFYCSAAWFKLRDAYRAAYPLCAECLLRGIVKPTEHIHHKQSRKSRPDLALSWDNLQSLCRSCHSAKTRRGE